MASGYRERRRTAYRVAANQIRRGLNYSYVHRKQKKRLFRRLWIARINAACRMNGTRYAEFIHSLAGNGSEVDRKMLADIAVHDPEGFTRIVQTTIAGS